MNRSVLSYGGGVQSTALLVLLAAEGALDLAIYADLGGAESPDTQAYVRNIAIPYAQRVGVQFEVVSAGDMLADMLARPGFAPAPFRVASTGVPLRRQCTRQYKVAPIRRRLRALYPGCEITLHLGISVDEYTRMRTSDVQYIVHSYPLVDRRLTRQDCIDIIRRAGLPQPPKSSCWLCPYRSAREQQRVVERYPHLRDVGMLLEQRVNAVRRARGLDEIIVLHRLAATSSESQQLVLEICEAGHCGI